MTEPSPLADYFAMGGYAAYVWPAFIVAIVTIAGMALHSRLQWRQLQNRLRALEKSSGTITEASKDQTG